MSTLVWAFLGSLTRLTVAPVQGEHIGPETVVRLNIEGPLVPGPLGTQTGRVNTPETTAKRQRPYGTERVKARIPRVMKESVDEVFHCQDQ